MIFPPLWISSLPPFKLAPTHNMGFSAQLPATEGPSNLTPKMSFVKTLPISEIPRGGRCGSLLQIARLIFPQLLVIRFRASQGGVWRPVRKNCRRFESQFRTILCNCAFSIAPFRLSDYLIPKHSSRDRYGCQKPHPRPIIVRSAFFALCISEFSAFSEFSWGRLPQTSIFRVERKTICIFHISCVFAWSGPQLRNAENPTDPTLS